MKKVAVYVAWDRETSDKLNENGKVALSKVEKYEFNTQEAADAFCKGIELATGWDDPMVVKGDAVEVKKRTLHLK